MNPSQFHRTVLTPALLLLIFVFMLPHVSVRAASLKHLSVKVSGQTCEALVAYPKSSSKPAPVVFVFHGHGNTMQSAAKRFASHEHWPAAICVYMQGLKTPSPNDPQGKESGWELTGYRDYMFFDAVLAKLKKEHSVDNNRIFATGFSNGAHFTYGLWARRGGVLKAVAPVAGFYTGTGLSPKPCLVIAGKEDKKFKAQTATIELARKVNGAQGKGAPWPKHTAKLHGTRYSSSKGAPTAKLIHDGGHKVPDGAPARIVEFFKEVAN